MENMNKKMKKHSIISTLALAAGITLFTLHAAQAMHNNSVQVTDMINHLVRVTSWKAQNLPGFLGGVSKQEYQRIITSLEALSPQEQNDIKVGYWIATKKPFDSLVLHHLTTQNIFDLGQAGRLPRIQQRNAFSFADSAQEIVQNNYKSLVKSWDKKHASAVPAAWFNMMPNAFQTQLKGFFRSFALSKNWNYWLNGDTSVEPTLEQLLLCNAIKLPESIQIASFLQLDRQQQIAAYVQAIENIENHTFFAFNRKRAILALLKNLPQSFLTDIVKYYAITHNYQTTSKLFEQGNEFSSIAWGFSLAEYFENHAIKNVLNQHIANNHCLHINENKIHSIGEHDLELLQAPHAITELIIESAELATIHPHAFNTLTNLEKITIKNTSLTHLPGNLFAHNTKLKALYITNNTQLQRADSNLFAGLERQKIELIDLSYNHFSHEHLPLMGGLDVAQIRLSGNNITTLTPQAFCYNTNNMITNTLSTHLQELWLDHNAISDLAQSSIHQSIIQLRQLRCLNLANNLFTGKALGDIAAYQLPHLEYLSLANNVNIQSLSTHNACLIYTNKQEMPSLKALDLSGCSLTSFDVKDFSIVPQLRILDLRHNSIHTINNDTLNAPENLQYVTTLHLGCNEIEKITATSFKGFISLTQLYLEGNKITEIQDFAFTDLHQLQTLIMFGNNRLFSWDESKSGLPMTIAKNAFSGLAALTLLDLSFNNITTLTEKLFSPCTELQKLNLGHNGLTKLENNIFYGAFNLKKIDLSGNKITSIERDAFAGLSPNCKKIQMQGNNAFGIMSYVNCLRPYMFGGCAASFEKSWNHKALLAPFSRFFNLLNPRSYKPFMAKITRLINTQVHELKNETAPSLLNYENYYKELDSLYYNHYKHNDSKVTELSHTIFASNHNIEAHR